MGRIDHKTIMISTYLSRNILVTKLNIKYFINEVVDPDEEADIYDYFRSAENDNIRTAMEELGEDDYDEINVRLVRIKFHSDLGN